MKVIGKYMKLAHEETQGGNNDSATSMIVSLPTMIDDRKVVKRVPPAGSPSLRAKRRRRTPGNLGQKKIDLSKESVIPVDEDDSN